MSIHLLLSRLASAQTRGAAARGLAALCGVGFIATFLMLAVQGRPEQWFFALLVWALFVYAPLRIVLEAAGTLAPALRRRLAAEAAGAARPSSAEPELIVERALEQAVVMPRIATPVQKEKARDGALAVLVALRGQPDGLPAAVAATLGCVERWVTELGPWAQRDTGQNIQARWRDVRALAAMVGMTRVLVELAPPQTAADPGTPRAFLDACLDYCDELALEVDVEPWTGTDPGVSISPARAGALRDAWRTYAETGAPALEARRAFITLLLQPEPTNLLPRG